MASSKPSIWTPPSDMPSQIQDKLSGSNQLNNEISVSIQLKPKGKYIATIQTKDILSALKQLLDIITGNISQTRKPSTSRRLHPASLRGIQPHKSLTFNEYSSALLAYQINHITFKIPHSDQEGRLLTDTTSDRHTSFYTMLQMMTKQGSKSLQVRIGPGAEVNMIPLSMYRKLSSTFHKVRQPQKESITTNNTHFDSTQQQPTKGFRILHHRHTLQDSFQTSF